MPPEPTAVGELAASVRKDTTPEGIKKGVYMINRFVVRDEFDQVIFEDVIVYYFEEELENLYRTALRFNATVHRYPVE